MEELNRLNDELKRVRLEKDRESIMLEGLRKEEKRIKSKENERKELTELLQALQTECGRKEKKRMELLEVLKKTSVNFDEEELNMILSKLRDTAPHHPQRLPSGKVPELMIHQIIEAKNSPKRGPDRMVSDLTMDTFFPFSSSDTFPLDSIGAERTVSHEEIPISQPAAPRRGRRRQGAMKVPDSPVSGMTDEIMLARDLDISLQDSPPPRPCRKKSQDTFIEHVSPLTRIESSGLIREESLPQCEMPKESHHISMASTIFSNISIESKAGRLPDGLGTSGHTKASSVSKDIHYEPLAIVPDSRTKPTKDIHLDPNTAAIFSRSDEAPGLPVRRVSQLGAGTQLPPKTSRQATFADIVIDPKELRTNRVPSRAEIIVEGAENLAGVPFEINLSKAGHAMKKDAVSDSLPGMPHRRASTDAHEVPSPMKRVTALSLSEKYDSIPSHPSRQQTAVAEIEIDPRLSRETALLISQKADEAPDFPSRQKTAIGEIPLENETSAYLDEYEGPDIGFQSRNRTFYPSEIKIGSPQREACASPRKKNTFEKDWSKGNSKRSPMSMDSSILSSPSVDCAPRTPRRQKSDEDKSTRSMRSEFTTSPAGDMTIDSEILSHTTDDKAPKTPSRRPSLRSLQRESMRSLSSQRHILVDMQRDDTDEVIDMSNLSRRKERTQ